MRSIPPNRRYVFVCGLHRSGTSLLARALAEHPAASGFQNTGAIEDEGDEASPDREDSKQFVADAFAAGPIPRQLFRRHHTPSGSVLARDSEMD